MQFLFLARRNPHSIFENRRNFFRLFLPKSEYNECRLPNGHRSMFWSYYNNKMPSKRQLYPFCQTNCKEPKNQNSQKCKQIFCTAVFKPSYRLEIPTIFRTLPKTRTCHWFERQFCTIAVPLLCFTSVFDMANGNSYSGDEYSEEDEEGEELDPRVQVKYKLKDLREYCKLF